MHRISTIADGLNLQTEELTFVEQTPATFVFLTSADTDIQTLSAAVPLLGNDFPTIRVVNLLQLQHQISIDTYASEVLAFAKVIILRLLGGRSYWSYGLEVVKEISYLHGINLIVIPGDDSPDPDLISHSNLSLSKVNIIWRYFTEGGINNLVNCFQFIANECLLTQFSPSPPQVIPKIGIYNCLQQEQLEIREISSLPKVGILFYRAHFLAGNTQVIDALCEALLKQNLKPIPIFISSLRDVDIQLELVSIFSSQNSSSIDLLLTTTSFSLARLEIENEEKAQLWHKLNVPVIQVILSSNSQKEWESGYQGLSPRDIAMNVALPEVDGRIISRAVSFKSVQNRNSILQTDVINYEPEPNRIEFVAQLSANWVRLKKKPPRARKIALILANYPTRDGRIANGVGLDTPASCIEILAALAVSGYKVENIPKNSEILIKNLTKYVTNDLEGRELRPVSCSVSVAEYKKYFASLPETVQNSIMQRWGQPLGEKRLYPQEQDNYQFAIPGIKLGNIFVGIQPSRGYDADPSLNYHAPDLEPTHDYLAFYYWVRELFEADAIIHLGKHGNLEWLPGKSIALSENCYPEVALGAVPHLYPFIVNDPGEGSQAKRRSQGVIIDHLTPPLTRAELYGNLQELENLVDEYYEAESLDPSRLQAIGDRIAQLIIQENLYIDLGIAQEAEVKKSFDIQNLNHINGYLCELKEAQIRDGLHIFGQCPQGEQLRNLIVAITRHPHSCHLGFTRAIAQDWGLDFDPLTSDFDLEISPSSREILIDLTEELSDSLLRDDKMTSSTCRTVGDGVEILEQHAAYLVKNLIHGCGQTQPALHPQTQLVLDWINSFLLKALEQTNREICNLLNGLDGAYIPSAPAGAPTRGRPEVLPTGNNFYSVDIRALPTETAWDVGRKAAENLIEFYAQEHGEYPKTLALSMWGTATMRTGGDDISEALACLGVQPVWDSAARKVVDFEILPVSVLGRPRVDVTLRVSGFFRDAFPNLIDLFDKAVTAVAALNESPESNPLALKVKQETEYWQKLGLSESEAQLRSRYRIFGSKPGAYGAGLQGLIESQNWQDDRDLARAYINWSCYAYTSQNQGKSAPEAFTKRLEQIQVVLHNQDNREHDLLDSDDYYQFQGGLAIAVRSTSGQNPEIYFGDNSVTSRPKVRPLRAEIAKVYRSRVINPKWIEGVMRHGYKGAFEISATVDYLFAYDATTSCVENYMYQGVAQAYLLDEKVCDFIEQHNPWALRDIAERLLEAHKRNLWQDVDIRTLENLRNIVHQAEATIEEQ
ncbi:MAG: cobaltochelatase subunit CobN [Cyanobacteria bacterium P01_A01_bin.45]